MNIYVIRVKPKIDYSVRELCYKPYYGHPKGCPNYGKKKGCPPQAPYYDDVYDLNEPVYAIVNKFDFIGHISRMKSLHPDWSERQLKCCLYWQPTARKQLMEGIKDFLKHYPEYIGGVELCPEAMGINVTSTLEPSGIMLEWPPIIYTYQVALAGIKLRRGKDGKGKIDKRRST